MSYRGGVITGVLGTLLLIGAGVAAWWFVTNGPPAAAKQAPPAPPATVAKPAKEDQFNTITLTAPKPSFLETLTLPGAFIVPQGASDFTKGPTCTGPYEITEWTPDQQVVLSANDKYWGGAPAIKKVIMKVIPQESEQEVEFEAGSLDMVFVAPADIARLQGDLCRPSLCAPRRRR